MPAFPYLGSMTETKTELLGSFNKTTEDLAQLIERFDHETFNYKPLSDKWSAGEVVEHLLIFDKRLTMILADATHATDRAINEQVAVFAPRVTDRINKIVAPPFLIPTPGIKSAAELIQQIREERKKIVMTIEKQDLSLHSKEYPHRFYGEMTGLEWIKLIDLHARRHMEQLNELLHG